MDFSNFNYSVGKHVKSLILLSIFAVTFPPLISDLFQDFSFKK